MFRDDPAILATPAGSTAPSQPAAKPRGWLKGIFNKQSLSTMAVGAVVGFGVKTSILTLTGAFAAPAAGVTIAAASISSVAAAYVRHEFKNRSLEKDQRKKFTGKDALKAALLGGLGGSLSTLVPHEVSAAMGAKVATAFHGISDRFHSFAGLFKSVRAADVVPAAKIIPITPAPVHLAETIATPIAPQDIAAVKPAPVAKTVLDRLKDYVGTHNVSSKAKDALARAMSGHARVAAQGMDDLGVMSLNNTNGFSGIEDVGYKALEKAAKHNTKAAADLATVQFTGNAKLGIKADPEAALNKVSKLSKLSKFAARLRDHWVGTAAPASPEISAPAAVSIEPVADIAPATPAVPDTAAVAPAAGIGPDCTAKIDITSDQVDITCVVDAADQTFHVGETITIERPPVLHVLKF